MTHGTGGSDSIRAVRFFDANGTEFPSRGSSGKRVPLWRLISG